MGNFGQGGFNRNRSGGGFRGRRFDDDDEDSGERRPRSFGGGGRRFGGSRSFGGRERRPFEMHDVICDECGKECQVPFKPTEGKPVLCSECFEKSGNQRSRGGRNSSPGISQEQLDKINAKLDKIMAALKVE